MSTNTKSVEEQAQAANKAGIKLASASSDLKNYALLAIANAIEDNQQRILQANARDLEAATTAKMDFHLVDRMTLNDARIKAMATAAREIAKLPDPIGEILEERVLPNELHIQRIRVPLGVNSYQRSCSQLGPPSALLVELVASSANRDASRAGACARK